MPVEFFFSILWQYLILIGKLMSSKSNWSANISSVFLILTGWCSAGCKYLSAHHFKHLLALIFCILIQPFLGWSNSFGNLIYLLPAKALYLEILILCSMAESVIQPEPFPKYFCMFDLAIVQPDINTLSSMSFLSILVSAI